MTLAPPRIDDPQLAAAFRMHSQAWDFEKFGNTVMAANRRADALAACDAWAYALDCAEVEAEAAALAEDISGYVLDHPNTAWRGLVLIAGAAATVAARIQVGGCGVCG